MQARYRAMVQTRPPGGARFKIASDVFDITRNLLIARIRADRPNISKGELRQELFLHYYGNDFSTEERGRILAAIAAYWARKEARPPVDDSVGSAAARPIQADSQPTD
jgi:hypothetical protein